MLGIVINVGVQEVSAVLVFVTNVAKYGDQFCAWCVHELRRVGIPVPFLVL